VPTRTQSRSHKERFPRDRPEITGEFFPVHSNAVIVKALLLGIEKACVYHEGDGNHFFGRAASCWGGV